MTAAENGNWYMVNRDGMATLCTDRADAEQEAADAQRFWPHMGPHRAVQLIEAADAPQDSFDHGPQATSIDEAARDVGKWLNERPNRPIDLRHVAMLCAHATAADVDALRAGYAAARLALVQYGAHDGACSVGDLDDEGRHCACDCGYESAIKAAEDKAHQGGRSARRIRKGD